MHKRVASTFVPSFLNSWVLIKLMAKGGLEDWETTPTKLNPLKINEIFNP
jgi:hypothetical protein